MRIARSERRSPLRYGIPSIQYFCGRGRPGAAEIIEYSAAEGKLTRLSPIVAAPRMAFALPTRLSQGVIHFTKLWG